MNAQQSRLQQLRALAKLKKRSGGCPQGRAGTSGVLQTSVGGRWASRSAPDLTSPGLPIPLRSSGIKIAETQIPKTSNWANRWQWNAQWVIQGKVSRIDPAAREGTFVVDAELTGPLPSSARPDLSVDGTIELERLINVLYVGRPLGQGQQTVGLFAEPGRPGSHSHSGNAGRTSVSTVEIVSGLREAIK